MKTTRSLSSSSLRWLLAASLLTCTLISPGRAGIVEILDPAAQHSVLRGVADALDGHGIDVLQDWASRATIGSRPALAPLLNYPIPRAQRYERMAREIYVGTTGGIAAFSHNNYESLEHDNFARQWQDADPEKRIFISFAREDADDAEKVRKALDSSGFVTFTYLRRADAPPQWTLSDVGLYLKTSGQQFVLHTPTARLKEGVIAEAIANALYGPGNEGARAAHVIEVFGLTYCERTQWVVGEFEKADATVLFSDVEKYPLANEMLEKNTQYLVGGTYLPLVRVDGKFLLSTDANIRKVLRTFPSYDVSRPTRSPPAMSRPGACVKTAGR
jgi:hypothetical protein